MWKTICSEEEFKTSIKDHKLSILKNDELYKHLRFKNPSSFNRYFDIVTWPGNLCYTGDMGTYTFKRIENMIYFFSDGVNPDYWSEKLTSISKFGEGVKVFDGDKFKEYFIEFINEDDNGLDSLYKEEILEDLKLGNLDLNDEHEILDYITYHYNHYTVDHITSWYAENYNLFKSFTYHYIWCCRALNWSCNLFLDSKHNTGNVE